MTKKDKHMIKNATPHMMDQYIGHFALFKLPPPIPLNLDPPDLDPLISPLSKADDEEVEAGTLQLGKSGQVKIRRSRIETAAPSNLEELRAKITLMANHFIFARLRYSNKGMLADINPFTFLDYVGYLTGNHVAQMETQTVDGITLRKPSIKLITNYEHQMRKEVIEQMNLGKSMSLEIKAVTKNADIRERHFSTPLAVSSATQSLTGGKGKERGWDADRCHTPRQNEEKEKEKGRKEKGSTRETSCIRLLQMVVNYASRGTMLRRAAKEIATEYMPVGFASLLRTPLLTTRRSRQTQEEQLKPLDKRSRFHATRFSTCSVARSGKLVWQRCSNNGLGMQNLFWRLRNGTSLMVLTKTSFVMTFNRRFWLLSSREPMWLF